MLREGVDNMQKQPRSYNLITWDYILTEILPFFGGVTLPCAKQHSEFMNTQGTGKKHYLVNKIYHSKLMRETSLIFA